MALRSPTPAGGCLRVLLSLLAALTATAAHADFVRVTAANAVDDSLYNITSFSPPSGSTTPLNSDGASHGEFTSLVLAPNLATGTVDVLVADATRGQIIRYTPAVGATPSSETVVWHYTTRNSGPAHPDGLSQDAAGNLYIATSSLHDDSGLGVWVLPTSASSPTGFASTPLLIDGTVCGFFGIIAVKETVVATTTTAAWSPGDLLVLVGTNPNGLLRFPGALVVYRAATLTGVLAGSGPRREPDAVLINPAQFPPGEYPMGVDFWPPDTVSGATTLLMSTTAGRVLRYDFTAGAGGPKPSLVQVLATGLGGGLQKIKVGLQLEIPYAFVTQIGGSTGDILQLGAPVTAGVTNLVGVATQGVQSPDGLAVARAAAVSASTCAEPAGCDLSGGALPHNFATGSQTVSGNIIENTCVVLEDPRITQYGSCTGHTLAVASVCPGFGNEIIPDTLCGGSGVSGAGFALARTLAPGVDGVPGILVYTQENVDAILPPAAGSTNPPCPLSVMSWVPYSDATPSEGSIVEIDPATQLLDLTDLTGYCDGGGSISRGLSIYGIGFTLNVSALSGGLTGYAQSTYNNLYTTVTNSANAAPAGIVPATAKTLETALTLVNDYLGMADYACAASQVVAVDATLGADPNPALDYPGNAANPNPWAETRGRLAKLYMILNARILNNPPNTTWPLVLPDKPPVCAPPVVNLTASPASISPGGSATISWNALHATSCTAFGGDAGWAGGKGVSGSYATPSLTSTTSYTLSCTGNGGTTPAVASVTVVPPPTIGSFTASPSIATSGVDAVTLKWTSSNASSCSVTGGSANGTGTSGTLAIGTLASTTTFTLTCSNSLGVPVSQAVTVTVVPPPSIGSFTATPSTVARGVTPVTLSWSASNATSCTLTGGGLNISGTSGSQNVGTLQVTTTYTLTCNNAPAGDVVQSTATVTVLAQPTIQSFTATPSQVDGDGDRDDVVTLAWKASATSCAITGGGLNVSGLAANGSLHTPPLRATTTFTLTCTNSLNGSATATTTVTKTHHW